MIISPDFTHPALSAKLPSMMLVANCYYANVQQYLIDPSPENEDFGFRNKRFEDYKKRAVFYNATRKTAKTLAGLVFSKYPMVDIPAGIEKLQDDIDGTGVTLVQQARRALIEILLKGRCGLLADFPSNAGEMTLAELKAANAAPVITLYEAQDIINYRVEQRRLTLVVLRDSYVESDDGFNAVYGEQLLVLRLTNGIATAERYRRMQSNWVSMGINEITDNTGAPFNVIPFTFVGADNNDADIDDSPLFDLASINVAHYRNSADYEDSVHLVGQPTLFVSGLTDTWGDDDTDPIVMGSRQAHLIPLNATVNLVQAEPNNLVFEAMKHKEEQMVALGAKLIEANSSTKTATEAGGDLADEASILTTLANNLSDGYSLAAKWAGRFAGTNPNDDYVINLNTVYTSTKLNAQEIQVLLQLWQSGAITFAEFRSRLVENETATIEDSLKAKDIIESELPQPIFAGD